MPCLGKWSFNNTIGAIAMGKIPSFQSILLEIHQSLACKWPGNSELKSKFVNGDCSLEKLIELQMHLGTDIFDTLELDPQAQLDSMTNIKEFSTGLNELSANLWTFKTNPQQILWMLLTHHYIPGIARYTANWQLAHPWDMGMPGGKFWYLPERRVENDQPRIILPVTQVIEWLMDLLGTSIEAFADSRSEATNGVQDSLRRSLYKWMNDTLPEASTIKKYFDEKVSLKFNGTFTPEDSISVENQFKEALSFISRKKLTAGSLRLEIPMTQPGRLEAVLEGNADNIEKQCFIDCLAERYAEPSMHTIRQRFLIARAVQEGYTKLLNFLCPGVDRLCTDPLENKLLQAFGIYEMVFNVTVDAYKQKKHLGLEAENEYFQTKIPVIYHPLLLSILPSMRRDGVKALASDLTTKFWSLDPHSPLINVFATTPETSKPIFGQIAERVKNEMQITSSIINLTDAIKTSSPWRALQKESSFWVVSQIAQRHDIPSKAKNTVIIRLKEIAKDADELVSAFCIELGNLIGQASQKLTKFTKVQVEQILIQIDSIEHSGLWNPTILRLKGFHALYSNNFKDAETYFRKALDECDKGQYGELKGTLARDAFAVAVAANKVNPNNHQRYLRLMLLEGIIESITLPEIEDVAVECSEYFWNTLYKSYLQHPKFNPKDDDLFSLSIEMIFNENHDGITHWLQKNRTRLQKPMADVRGDTLLLLWIKARNKFVAGIPYMKHVLPKDVQQELTRFERNLSFWHSCICMLIETVPKSVNITDFKAQSPLMLAAQAGDALLVNTLLTHGADPDLQDFKGRTALHGAVKSANFDTVKALVSSSCNLKLTTYDGMTALHTACWKGNIEAVKLLSASAPSLVWTRYKGAPTPLEFVEKLIDEPAFFDMYNNNIQKKGHPPLSKSKLKEVFSILEKVELPAEA